MSGIEVAGLVLGGFPLIISALENYRGVAERLKIFWKIKREYKFWVHDLKICELTFESNLETLLLPLVADDDEIQELLKDPAGSKWQDPELEQRLKERLPKSYLLYVECITQVKDIIVEMKKHLGIDRPELQKRLSEEVVWSDGSIDAIQANMSFHARRLMMSFAKSKRESLFKQLTKANNDLREILDTSDKIALLRQERSAAKKPGQAKAMRQFWRHADHLYNLLSRSWHCECKSSHLANLLLQHRTSAAPNFHLLFLFGSSSHASARPPAWYSYQTCMRIMEVNERPTETPLLHSSPPSSTQVIVPTIAVTPPPSSPSLVAGRASSRTPSPSPTRDSPSGRLKRSIRVSFKETFFSGQKTKSTGDSLAMTQATWAEGNISNASPADQVRITFALPTNTLAASVSETPKSSGDTTTNWQGASRHLSTDSVKEMVAISNLCQEIPRFFTRTKDEAPVCLQHDHYRAAIEHSLYQPRPSAHQSGLKEQVTLEALLKKGSPRTMTRRERYLLALTLAASYFQLKSSPWIQTQWSKRDIIFWNDTSNSHVSSHLRLDQPYVARRFEGISTNSDINTHGEELTTPLPPTGPINHNDRTLASLGIMLLELCFGTALEEHETRKKYNVGAGDAVTTNPFLDMAAALEWSTQVAEEAGPEFSEAVDWCLKNMPGSGKSDGSPDKWREELFERVVLPLKYCHDQVAGIRG